MRRLTTIALLLALVATAPGCGRRTAAVRAEDGVFEVVLDDYRIRPQVIRADAGTLVVTVRNVGRLPHNFRVRGLGGTRMKISTQLPGARFQRSFRLGPGEFRMFCSIANHEELGMYGTLVVR